MNCDEIKDKLFIYLDEELDDEDMSLVSGHLEKCEGCKKELEACKKIISTLKALPDEEPPKGYCKRLSAKLIEEKGKNKIKNLNKYIKYIGIAAVLLIVLSSAFWMNLDSYDNQNMKSSDLDGGSYGIATGEGRSKVNETVPNPMSSPIAPEISDEMYDDNKTENKMDTVAPASVNNDQNSQVFSNDTNRELKIVKSANIYTKTKEFDLYIENLINVINSCGGYIEFNNTRVSGQYEDEKLKFGDVGIRIPQTSFDDIVKYIENSGEVINKNINETDLTKQYYDKDSRLKNLEAQEVQIRKLFEKAELIADIIQIENELNRIRSEIDALNIDLRDIDDRASMSTIILNIEEVEEYNIKITAKDNIWDRAKNGFIKTINNIIYILENLAVFIVSILPIIVPIGLIVSIVYIVKKRKR